MPPKRSRSKTPTGFVGAQPLADAPAFGGFESSPSGRKSTSKSQSKSEDAEVQRLIDEALARARAARSGAVTPRPSARASSGKRSETPAAAAKDVDAKDGEADTAPEDGQVGGFFSAADRVYSRKTTQCLTDLAGFFLLSFLAFYFTVAGYWFYQEISKSYAEGA